MIYYKTDKKSDPYTNFWKRETWLHPIENADKIRFPLIVTVEPTNRCSHQCLYCSRQLMKREYGYLDLEIMKMIAVECAKFKSPIRHGGFGEPLLHPDIEEIIAISCERDVMTTIFTNAYHLNEKMMRSFIANGLTEIRFSSSGVSAEEHNGIRRGNDYDTFIEKIQMAHRLKLEMKSERPFLTLYSNVLNYDSPSFTEKVDDYVKFFLRYVDKVDIDFTNFSRVKRLEHVKDLYERQSIKEVYKPCVDLFLKFIVHWNADVFACDKCYNYEEDFFLGNLMNPAFSIETGANSEKIKSLRENLSFSMNHEKYALCSDCFCSTTKWKDVT